VSRSSLDAAPSTIGRHSATKSLAQVRCALYVRKSTEEGLEQAFNSLDAQRLACEEYVRTRAAEGWTILPEQYTDGGWSGATVKRPAFQRLLADIEARRIDCVVVHRVDRLSRSLLDFARLMAFFQEHGVAFVSVTQNFSTADAVGRMTLNLLAVFSEFEREMIVARTRDKIGAAKRRGRWCGGTPLLGFDLDPAGGRLMVNEDEAVMVREIFRLYLATPSLTKVVEELGRRGWRRKSWTRKSGVVRDGSDFDKPSLARLLKNPLYQGKVHHRGTLHAGEHPAIVDAVVWDRVQALLSRNSETGGKDVRNRHGALLKGLLCCAVCDSAMSHTFARKGPLTYRYYTCQSRIRKGAFACPTGSVPAHEVERQVVERIRAIGRDTALVAETVRQARCQLDERRALLDVERRQLTKDLGRQKVAMKRLLGATTADGAAPGHVADVVTRIETKGTRLAAIALEIEAAKGQEIDEHDVARALEAFGPLWEELWPAERARIVALLAERITYDGRDGTIGVWLRADGIRSIADPT